MPPTTKGVKLGGGRLPVAHGRDLEVVAVGVSVDDGTGGDVARSAVRSVAVENEQAPETVREKARADLLDHALERLRRQADRPGEVHPRRGVAVGKSRGDERADARCEQGRDVRGLWASVAPVGTITSALRRAASSASSHVMCARRTSWSVIVALYSFWITPHRPTR